MRKPRLPETYPTPRLAVAFAASSLWFFAVPWGGALFMWLGIAQNLAILVLAVADCLQFPDSRMCTVAREPLTTLAIGERNTVWVCATHRGERPFNVRVRDEPPVEFESSPLVLEFVVSPDEMLRTNYKVLPHERGDYVFGDLNVRYTTKLGLLERQERIASQTVVKVYPDILQTRKQTLLSRENRVAHMGLRRSRMYGHGREFARLRDYVPDDSIHDIDWKATARRGIPITREYDIERSQTIMILLDIGRNMASRTLEEDGTLGMTKADCAINASVLLAHVAAQSDDRVGLLCFAREPVAYIPPGKGAPQAARLLDALYAVQPRVEESAYYENFMYAAHRQRKRSLCFLFTDLIDEEASSRLISSISILASKHLVVCVALADYELPAIIDSRPSKPTDLYTQTVALSMVRSRKKALSQLSSRGVLTIDAAPSDLSVATVNKYLQLKHEGRV